MYPVATMCRLLGVSTSGYYAWQGRAPSARTESDEALLDRIREIHRISQGTYGAPRIHAELVARGYAVGRKRVARLMRRAGLRGISRRKGTRTTTRDARARAAPDLVERDFTADAPDRLWVADITYIPTWAGFLFLAVVLDAFSRRVVGWLLTNNAPRGAIGRSGRGGAKMRHSWSLVGCDEGQEMYGVELYAAVRLAVVDEGLSHHEAGRRFGIDRRTVKKMLSYSAPPGYRRTKPVRRPKLDGFTGIVDAILEADTDPDVPRKQRHTAHRIFERLRDEHGFSGGYTIQTVSKRRRIARNVISAHWLNFQC